MVGRLVQQHQIRGRHQRTGQVEPDAPAPRERRHRRVQFLALKAQPQQQLLGPPLGAVAVELLHALVQRGRLLVISRGIGASQILQRLKQCSVARDHIVPGGEVAGLGLLRHMRDAQALEAANIAGISL